MVELFLPLPILSFSFFCSFGSYGANYISIASVVDRSEHGRI